MRFSGRKWTTILLVFLFSFAVIAGAVAENGTGNLIRNGGFETLGRDGIPEGWYTDAWELTAGYTQYKFFDSGDGNHGTIAEIYNIAGNDARLAQNVDVEPDTVYCLSGYVRGDGIDGGRGANLSVEGVYAFSEAVYDTAGDWRYIEYYGETGPDQRQITVYVRLGGYSGESTGKAWFDNISLTAVETVPRDIIADRWYIPAYSSDDTYDDYETEPETAGPAWPYLLIAGIIWVSAFSVITIYFRGRKRDDLLKTRSEMRYFLPVLGVALVLRVILSIFVEGYMVDVNCFNSWGNTMADWGPTQFYPMSGFCDYPPLYTYVLGLNALIIRWLGITDAAGMRVVQRLLPSLCDTAFCWILYEYARRKVPGQIHRICVILILIAFSPATIINSAAWGQMDSALCLMLVMVALLAVEDNWEAAIPVYALSVLVKPQALMLGFLGLAYMVITCVRQKKLWWKTMLRMLIGAGIAVVLMIIGIVPFGVHQHFGWLIEQYRSTLGSYPYATVNTANFYYLLGGNWNRIESTAHIAAPILLAAGCAAYAVWWVIRNRDLRLPWIETNVASCFSVWFIACLVFKADWGYVGAAAMAFAFVITISMAIRKGDIRFLPYLGALLFILLYVFGVKMHERYLFPALFLLGTAWIIQRDRRILYLLALFTFTTFVNEGIVLDNSIRLGSAQGHLLTDTTALADILSILNVAGAVCAILTGHSQMRGSAETWERSEPDILRPRILPKKRSVLDYNPDRKLHWSRRDTAILSAITLIYSVITLTTLGSTKAPQTGWTSSGIDEEIVFDLGEYHDDIRILYFAKVSKHDFTISQSTDGEIWSDEEYAQMNEGQCWKWKYVTRSWEDVNGGRKYYDYEQYISRFQGRYIKIRSDQIGHALNEVIFRDSSGQPIPATIRSRTGENAESALLSDPALLLDEQDTLEALPSLAGSSGEAEPSWWNSTYFDEIYHARTGYEFTQGTTPYETSHPPLGKVLISWCISIFGMTPFGWRFAGALAGILMLPGMYLIGKQLTKKTPVAAFVCMLMALDCMHLTQTQIATIDSFPVLFILFAFFFMLRYIQTDISRTPLWRSMVPLGFSGLFMGLSIASKWIGIYAGAGLAVLFFWHGIRQIRICRSARKLIASGTLTDEETARLAPYTHGLPVVLRLFFICLWCVFAFVIIPIAVYLLSYIPYMAYNTGIRNFGDYLKAVWNSQIGMLNYHSTPGLGMDHPFYSPWYEWPVIGKPMYYASELYLPADTKTHFSIFSFGNPVVWWGGLATLAVCVYRWIAAHHYRLQPDPAAESGRGPIFPLSWHINTDSWKNGFSFVLLGLLAQYLPWVLVPRGTYIYHYFASIPFLILGAGLCMGEGTRRTQLFRMILSLVIIASALVAFIIFFPYMTGIGVSKEWLDIGKNILRVYY